MLHLAANVGGIGFNRRNPAPLAYDNLMMGANVFEACRELGVDKLVAACSVCAYPLHTPVPFREETIWDGYPEPSNAPYGLAKKMLIVFSDTYRRQYGFDSCAPVIANLYGPDDNFDLEDSHVIAAMVRKYVEAAADGHRDVTLWGSGRALARVPLRRRCRSRPDPLRRAPRRLRARQPRRRPRDEDPRPRRGDRERRRLRGRDRLGRLDARRADEARARRHPRPASSPASRPRSRLEEGIARTVEWFEANEMPATAGTS